MNRVILCRPPGVEIVHQQQPFSSQFVPPVSQPPPPEDDDDYVSFRPYHWEYTKEASTDIDTTQIRAWCHGKPSINEAPRSMLMRVETFPSFCFVELPSMVNGQHFRWDTSSASMFVDSVRWHMNQKCEAHAPLSYNPGHFGKYKKIYYYCGQMTYPMVMLTFKTATAMEKTAYMLKNMVNVGGIGPVKVNVWETEIDPVRKLLTKCSPSFRDDPDGLRQLGYTSWMKAKMTRIPSGETISTLDYEYVIDWTTLLRIQDTECEGPNWAIYPGCVSFDIECYSNRKQMFPDKNTPSHVAYMISATYQKLGKPEDRSRYAIILGDCKQIPEEKFSNTILYSVNTEEEMVRMFGALVRYHDPDFITGYNILSFDYPYLDARLGRTYNGWPEMSRLKGFKVFVKSNSWSSGAYGHNDINMLVCPGRPSIDMLNVTRRDYRMSSYSLGAVSKKFLNGKTKHDITAAQMFGYYEDMINGLKAKERSTSTSSSHIRNNYYDKNYPPMWVDELDPDMKEYDNGLNRITEVMLYCIQDSELVLDIMEATYWWLASIEMGSIVAVNVLDLSIRGQQVRCLSQLYHEAAQRGYILTTRVAPDIPFEGGSVQDPIQGLQEDVITIDFTSLYPSIMRAYNICYTTLVPPYLMKTVPDDECNTTPPINCNYEVDPDDDDLDEEEKSERHRSKGEKGTYRFKFVNKDKLEGLVPRIVSNLCNQRNKVKRLISAEWAKKKADPTYKPDKLYLVVLDKRQNGLKLSANSFFGFFGVRDGGMRPLIEGAMSITAWGREMIGLVIKYLIKTYNATIIYGDTDSAMIHMPNQIKNTIDAWYWGERIAKEVTALFPPPVNMEFEKVFAVLLTLKKKKYIGILGKKPNEEKYGAVWYDEENKQVMVGKLTSTEFIAQHGVPIARTESGDPEPFIRGVLVARRDNCKWSRDIYTDIMMRTLVKRYEKQPAVDTFADVVNILCDYVEPLVLGQVPAEDLCISRALGSNYKSLTYFMKVFADELVKEGKPARPGDRLEYVVMNRPNASQLGKKMMLKETYGERFGTDKEEKIDYAYYLEKQIQNHIDQLISIAFKDTIDKLEWITYRQNNRQKLTGLHDIVKMMVRLTNSNKPIQDLRDTIMNGIEYLKAHPPVARVAPMFVLVDEPVVMPMFVLVD